MNHKRNLSSPSNFSTGTDMSSIPEQEAVTDETTGLPESIVSFTVGQPQARQSPQRAKRSQSNDDSQTTVAHGRRRSIIKGVFGKLQQLYACV